MTDYQIQPNTRRCAQTGRELQAGERYFTALLEEGNQFSRKDYSQEAWQGPPQCAFSFWAGTVTAAHDKPKPRFDDELLEECFHRLEGQTEPSRLNFRYVVALLLVRRKRLIFKESIHQGNEERLLLASPQGKVLHEVVNPNLTEVEMAQVQEEVFKVLGWN